MKGISLIRGAGATPFSVAWCCNDLNGRLKRIAGFSPGMLDRCFGLDVVFYRIRSGVHQGYRICLDNWIQDTDSDIGYGSLDLLHKETSVRGAKK